MIGKQVELVFRDDEGLTVLHECIDVFHERKNCALHDIMRALISAGADVNLKGRDDWTPMHAAIARGDLVALEILAAAGANPDIPTTIDACESARDYAVRIEFKETTIILQQKPT